MGGGEGAGAAHLSHPMGLALSGDGGRLFVADSYNHRVVCYDAALRFRYAFGDEVGGASAVRPCRVRMGRARDGEGERHRDLERQRHVETERLTVVALVGLDNQLVLHAPGDLNDTCPCPISEPFLTNN
mgnify:CR=1 FL=1